MILEGAFAVASLGFTCWSLRDVSRRFLAVSKGLQDVQTKVDASVDGAREAKERANVAVELHSEVAHIRERLEGFDDIMLSTFVSAKSDIFIVDLVEALHARWPDRFGSLDEFKSEPEDWHRRRCTGSAIPLEDRIKIADARPTNDEIEAVRAQTKIERA